jgi:hypothetical protein
MRCDPLQEIAEHLMTGEVMLKQQEAFLADEVYTIG